MSKKGGQRSYEVLEHDEGASLTRRMPIGAEASTRRRHTTSCVICTVVCTVLLCSVLLGGASSQAAGQQVLYQLGLCEAEPVCETRACVELAAELLSNINASADPCEDFYSYACGGWIENHPLPDDKTRISTFDQLRDAGQAILKRELERQTNAVGTVAKAVRYYDSCMDTDAIDAAAAAPLQAMLTAAGLATGGGEAPAAIVARLHSLGASALFRFAVGSDDHDSTQNAVFVGQSGLSLPSRDYYVGKDLETDETILALVAHIARAQHLASPATAPTDESYLPRARAVVELEAALAAAMLSRVALRDPEGTYNALGIAELEALAPRFGWATYLRTLLPPGTVRPNIHCVRVFCRCPFSVASCWADRDARDRILAGVPGADGPHPHRGGRGRGDGLLAVAGTKF